MAFRPVLLRAPGETLGPVLQTRRRRRPDVVPLHEGVVLVARGVFGVEIGDVGHPAWFWAAFQDMDIRGAMYNIAGASSMASSSGRSDPATHLPTLLGASRWGVR